MKMKQVLIQLATIKKLVLLALSLSLNPLVFGQNYFKEFKQYIQTQDTAAQKEVLQKWEKAEPNSPELFTSYFNYYYLKSRKSVVSIAPEQRGEESLEIKDSLGKSYFMNDKTLFDKVALNKAFTYINKGIKKYPKRLDMRFGNIYVHGEAEDWEIFTQEIIKTIDYSKTINNQWLWTNNEALEEPKDFFMGSLQDYVLQLYNVGNDSLLSNMRDISEKVIEYYPNEVKFLSNISITYIVIGEYEKGLPYLLKAEQLAPEDYIVLSNIAVAYQHLKDTENAIKYFEKTVEFGDDGTKEFAKKELEKLKK